MANAFAIASECLRVTAPDLDRRLGRDAELEQLGADRREARAQLLEAVVPEGVEEADLERVLEHLLELIRVEPVEWRRQLLDA